MSQYSLTDHIIPNIQHGKMT